VKNNGLSPFWKKVGGKMPLNMQQSTEKTGNNIVKQDPDPGTVGQPFGEELMLALGDQNKRIRIAAISDLGSARDRRSYDHLVRLLSDRDYDIRYVTAEAMGNLGDIRALEPLRLTCSDENCFVRVAAREAISKILHCQSPASNL
jgi:hypothetical protein